MLTPWKETYNHPRQHIKKQRPTLPINVCLVKAMVFPVVMYGCENWTIKKAEHWRTYAFELWCWRRLLRVSWTVRRSNSPRRGDQSWVFIGRTDVEAEPPILWPRICPIHSQPRDQPRSPMLQADSLPAELPEKLPFSRDECIPIPAGWQLEWKPFSSHPWCPPRFI